MDFSNEKLLTSDGKDSVSDEEVLKHLTETTIFDEKKCISDEEILKYLTPESFIVPIQEHIQTTQNTDYYEEWLSDSENFMEKSFLNTQGIMKLLRGRKTRQNPDFKLQTTHIISSSEINSSSIRTPFNHRNLTDKNRNLIVIEEDKVIEHYICNYDNIENKSE